LQDRFAADRHTVTVQNLPNKCRSFSNEALNISWTKATVISVVADSPAAAATGDQILTFDNVVVPPRQRPAGSAAT
jgi:hypothetical protein